MTPFVFVSDLDHTFVNHSVAEDSQRQELQQKLADHRQKYGTKIIYATGRSPLLYRELANDKQLLQPDALVLSVGTEIYLQGSDTPDTEWVNLLAKNWQRETVVKTTAKFPELKAQPDSEQRQFKVSFWLEPENSEKILPEIESELRKYALNIKLIYSSGIDLDIVPNNSDKGQAMQFLRQRWGFAPEQTVACGDSGNDIALFATGAERGIIVGNARPELIQWYRQNPAQNRYLARNACAGGILEGLKHFGFIE